MPRGDDAGGVSRVNPRKLHMFHHRRHKSVNPVADGIRLTLCGMVQETVYENGPVRGHTHCRTHITGKAFIRVHYFHSTAAQYIGRAHHHGIANLMGNTQGLLHGGSHTRFGHGDFQFIHHGAELIPVLRQVDDRR